MTTTDKWLKAVAMIGSLIIGGTIGISIYVGDMRTAATGFAIWCLAALADLWMTETRA